MPLHIIRNDITKMEVDAIVNAANETLLGGGGVDGQIHAAAGPKLLEECKTLGGCKTGEAKITGAYNLPCNYVIHTVGPIWNDGEHGEEALLRSCYKACLEIAKARSLKSIAFPLISAGVYGYPKKEAFRVAVSEISDFLINQDDEEELDAYVVIFDKAFTAIGEKLYYNIEEYINDKYVDRVQSADSYSRNFPDRSRRLYQDDHMAAFLTVPQRCEEKTFQSLPKECCVEDSSIKEKGLPPKSLEDELKDLDESFAQMLFRMIDKRGMKDSEAYKKANIDRKLFSKIRSNVNYKPSKQTAIAFAIALEMNLTETRSLLKKAGFALSHSNKFDIIVEYFIKNKNYNIFELNEALYSFDQPTLGTL